MACWRFDLKSQIHAMSLRRVCTRLAAPRIGLSASSDHVIVLPGGGYAEHAANEGEPIAVAAGVGRRRQRVPLSADGATPRAAYCSPRKLRRAISLDALVTTDAPPFFIWHTAEDPYVPVEHTYRRAVSLAAQGVPHA